MLRSILAAVLFCFSSQVFAGHYFSTEKCRSVNTRVFSCGKDLDGFYAITEYGKERIENYNLIGDLQDLGNLELINLVEDGSIFFRVTRMSNNELKMRSYIKLRGGFYGDDMDDKDYKRTATQHGEARKQMQRAARDSEVQKAFVGGAISGASKGPIGAVGAGLSAGAGVAGYNALKGDYKGGSKKN